MTVKSYKQLDSELSTIIQRIEAGEYDDLDLLLKDYEAGKKLIEQLQTQLEKAKNSIKKVK